MKRKLVLSFLFLLLIFSCNSADVGAILDSDLPENWAEVKADYQPNWDSIDSREIPTWFKDAKFGIFIHWGLYSVPAWAPVGVYAEWYQNWLQSGHTWGLKGSEGNAVQEYHYKTYGKDFTYDQFAPMFKAENYKPEEWRALFENAGAKYIILGSKHHEGYALWPSKIANKTWGKKWNAMDVGPKRDLVGDLAKEIKKSDIKFGLYYSLYEWYNPLYKKASKREFVEQHYIPQLKELVTGYSPDILWADGEWELGPEKWRSREVLSWILNHTPNQKTFVLNDRWGKGIRFHHAGYYTAEYGAGFENDAHPWEECRGMGYSFGYNQNEADSDYRSVDELLITLIDIASRGGNLLLNIGPKADGTIPDVMQNRLKGMGKWLSKYGDAIYGTRSWNRSCQWSDGKIPNIKGENLSTHYDIVKFTVKPDEGMAVKEVFFTCKKDGNGDISSIYLISPKKLASGSLVVKNMDLVSPQSVNLLSSGASLPFSSKDGSLIIDVSSVSDDIFALELKL